jgi:hypothetical protein
MCGRPAEYANKPYNGAKVWTFVRNAAFRATPHHSVSCRATPHLCRATPHLCRSCCGIFRTKQLGQATLLHKIIHLKWSNTPERNCILPEVLVKTALISIWTKLFVPVGLFTDSLLGIYTCSSPGLSKWGEKGKKRKCDVFFAKFEKK